MLGDHLYSILCIASAHIVTSIIRNQRNRWFLVHAILNIVISKLTIICLGKCTPDHRAMVLTSYLHIYHCLFYNITKDDLIHHVTFGILIGVPTMIFEVDPLVHRLLFFGCGLPGAFLYMILFSNRCFNCQMNERLYSMILYTMIRMPSMIFSSITILLQPKTQIDAFIAVVSILNSTMYGYQYYNRFKSYRTLENKNDKEEESV